MRSLYDGEIFFVRDLGETVNCCRYRYLNKFVSDFFCIFTPRGCDRSCAVSGADYWRKSVGGRAFEYTIRLPTCQIIYDTEADEQSSELATPSDESQRQGRLRKKMVLSRYYSVKL